MHKKNSTANRNSEAKRANTGVVPSDLTMISLNSDYPGLGFKKGMEIGVQPVNFANLDPAWLIAVRLGDDILIGYPHAIDEQQFGLAQPKVFKFSDVEILGELVAV